MRVKLLLNASFAVSLALLGFAIINDLAAVSPQADQAKQTAAQPAIAQPKSSPPAKGVSLKPDATTPVPASSAITKQAVAKDLFAAEKEPANLAARSIGFYAHGCLAGAKPLPVVGSAWQVMRLSRNRNWGHPTLIKFIERFAWEAKDEDHWPGLLVGDLSMPRGGPMPFGHSSHQVGLDVDIWYKPKPYHILSGKEREDIPMESFLSDPAHVNPQIWTAAHEKLLRRAASYPEVARIFVHPAIKKWLCDNAKGDRKFLHKIMPISGHDDHFHVRLVCPAGNPGCENQPVLPADEGCGKSLDKWIAALSKPAVAPVASQPATKTVLNKKPPLTMGQLPPECEAVLKAAPPAASANAAR